MRTCWSVPPGLGRQLHGSAFSARSRASTASTQMTSSTSRQAIFRGAWNATPGPDCHWLPPLHAHRLTPRQDDGISKCASVHTCGRQQCTSSIRSLYPMRRCMERWTQRQDSGMTGCWRTSCVVPAVLREPASTGCCWMDQWMCCGLRACTHCSTAAAFSRCCLGSDWPCHRRCGLALYSCAATTLGARV